MKLFFCYICLKIVETQKLPKIVQKSPYLILRKIWKKGSCCDLSNKDPYCDESHKATGFSAEIIEITNDRKIAW
tara:strand:+ start:317 stop:538 length:222 start_codon:yes stop_codon:yes gene_type:complete